MTDLLQLLMRIAAFFAGGWIVVTIVTSAIKTFVMPRSANTWLTRRVFQATNAFFRWRIGRKTTYSERDRVYALYAPVALISFPVVWLICVSMGYTLMYYALGVADLFDAFKLSGSSLLTLGIQQPETPLQTVFVFSEATLGLILVALLIGYLPTMYSMFSRRELEVTLLEVRAGIPPSAVTLLTRAYQIRGMDSLPGLWTRWEGWFGELGESHTSLGALSFFRSPKPQNSWVTASGAVLDAAALLNAAVDVPQQNESQLCIRAGYLALRQIGDFFRIQYDPDPQPTDPISIKREEFDAAYDELAAAGLPMKPDKDQCWRDFAGWRVNYDTVLLALAAFTMAPPAPWSSDRATVRM